MVIEKNSVDPAMYRLMVEQTKDYALFVLHPDGRIATWNAGAQRIKGYTAGEIIGRHFSTFYTQDAVDSGWPQHELRTAALEGRIEDEGWRVRKDGSRFWASVVITALRDEQGRLLGFSKITRDLSDRKRSDEELRLSEERFRLLIEGVVDYAIYMLDPEGIVSSWNVGAERIKGYGREEIIGKHFSRFYTKEDLEAGKPWDELATARRIGRAEDEGWRVKKSGERFWARVVVTALYDAEGRMRGFSKVTQDLSRWHHFQSLEKAAKNVNEFIATLAHELRNPLAPIRSAVGVMAKLPAGDPGHEKMRDMIDRQSAHLARIVDDMIDISRISRGTLSIERLPVDLAEVVQRSIEAAGPLMQAANHRLEIDLPDEALMVNGDINRLTQLLTNLLNNAARYTPENGHIVVKGHPEKNNVSLSVRDNGRGIEPHMLEGVFQMFVQGQESAQRIGGLGIGLALARKLAEMHGGSLEGRSEGENKGSEFTLQLPHPEKIQRVEEKPRAILSTPVKLQRVLVVDDNEDAAMALKLLLESLGHETQMAHNGKGALKLADEFHPDIVLLDIGMPDLDGYEVARRLRLQKKEPPMRIIALTGWGQEAARQQSREAGFDLHLVKPVDMEDLFRALDSNDRVH